MEDPRLNELNMNLIACQNFIIEHAEESDHPESHYIDFECFKLGSSQKNLLQILKKSSKIRNKGLIHSTFDFLHSAFDNNMIIADFVTFESDIKQLFLSTSDFHGGHVTHYTG